MCYLRYSNSSQCRCVFVFPPKLDCFSLDSILTEFTILVLPLPLLAVNVRSDETTTPRPTNTFTQEKCKVSSHTVRISLVRTCFRYRAYSKVQGYPKFSCYLLGFLSVYREQSWLWVFRVTWRPRPSPRGDGACPRQFLLNASFNNFSVWRSSAGNERYLYKKQRTLRKSGTALYRCLYFCQFVFRALLGFVSVTNRQYSLTVFFFFGL